VLKRVHVSRTMDTEQRTRKMEHDYYQNSCQLRGKEPLLTFYSSAFCGIKKDSKNLDIFLFFYNTSHYFCRPDLSRGLSAAVLQEKAIQFDFIGKKNAAVKVAFKSALLDANQQDIISVGGSTFVVAEII
jgi:hypothetical protein